MLSALAQFPAVALVGPRQCGKTTLAHMLDELPEPRFFDLENPRHRLILEDPLSTLRIGKRDLVVIDEAQRMPELFPVLRMLIDENRRPGQFLLLGSATPDLRRQSAESLAGRLMTIELTPFTAQEVVPDLFSLETLWERRGFYEGCRDLAPSEKWVVYPGNETLSLPNSVLALPLARAVERLRK